MYASIQQSYLINLITRRREVLHEHTRSHTHTYVYLPCVLAGLVIVSASRIGGELKRGWGGGRREFEKGNRVSVCGWVGVLCVVGFDIK